MIKWYLLCVLLFTTRLTYAQKSQSTYDHYLDYNEARFYGRAAKAFEMGKALLDSAGNLPVNTRIAFFNSMGKLYEDNKQPEKAIPLYEKVTAAVPNYYVAHRALGYLYLQPLNDLQAKLNVTQKNTPAYANLKASYKVGAMKVLPHLERAQACEPDDEILGIIKTLYTNIGDAAAINTLNQRLADLNKTCLDILNDAP